MKKFFKILFFIIIISIAILWLVKIFFLTHKYQIKNYNEDKIEKENSEEKRLKRLEKIEKRLGRYDKAKEIRHKKNNILMKYFLIATNMIYILAGPIILMLGAYLLLEKFVFKKQQPIVLIIFLIIGAFTGYWSLIKQVRDIK
mgnify:CR=1 FL=1